MLPTMQKVHASVWRVGVERPPAVSIVHDLLVAPDSAIVT